MLNAWVGGDLALAIALVSRWVCAAMACAKCAGHSEYNLFKNAKGRLYYFFKMSNVLFFQSPSCHRAANLSPWEMFVRKSSAVLFENHFVPTLWLATFVFAMWPASQAAGCPAKPNVGLIKILKFNWSPGHSANMLLPAGHHSQFYLSA
jgi:hypothetical protein